MKKGLASRLDVVEAIFAPIDTVIVLVDGKDPWLEVRSSSDHSGVPLFCLCLRGVDFRLGFGGVDENALEVRSSSDHSGVPLFCLCLRGVDFRLGFGGVNENALEVRSSSDHSGVPLFCPSLRGGLAASTRISILGECTRHF